MDVDTTNTTGSMDRYDAAAAFLERWTDPKEVSKDEEGAEPVENETVLDGDNKEADEPTKEVETDEDPSASEDEESTETKTKPATKPASDDDEVTFSVDGEERKVSVKDLKRLAGQEAALTRKSQEVSAEKKAVEDTRYLHHTALNEMVKRAEARYQPFANLDMLLASKEMNSDDFQAVRQEAAAAYTDLQFLTQELGTFQQRAAQEQQQSVAQAASDCIKVLSDPKTGIPGWNQQVYNELRSYATKNGMSQSVVDNITDPAALRLIHKAAAYDKIKQVATTKKVGSAKSVLKSTTNVSTTTKNDATAKTALATLKSTGSRQSAADFLMAKWRTED